MSIKRAVGRRLPGVPVRPSNQRSLDDAIWLKDVARVPAPADHFLSLCDNVVYPNGCSAGGFSDDAERNESESMDVPDYLAGLSVFLVREEGVEHLDSIKRILFDQGFDHMQEGRIPEGNPCQAVSLSREGSRGIAPWPESGGVPDYYLVLYDVRPIPPAKESVKEHPGLDNERISMARIRLQDLCNGRVVPTQGGNIIHAADNARQALYYLKCINPECIPSVREEAKRKYSEFVTPFDVICDLSNHARRAKVELIKYHGKKAICKTFKEGRQHYLEREVEAREVGAGLSELSDILEVGRNYVVVEFCDGTLDNISRIRPLFHANAYLPIWAIERLKKIILYYRERGYECVDFSPRNVVFDSIKGLKVIDFEFLQKVDSPSETLEGNWAWYSVPEGFTGNLPQRKNNDSLYRRRWFRYTGLPLYFCVHDVPMAVIHLVRGGMFFYFSINNARRKAVSLTLKILRLR